MASLEPNIRRVLDILIPQIHARRKSTPQPIILGITGLQGSGKSTWASKIVSLLTNEQHLNTVTISLDDLYKTHADLVSRRDRDPENKLYRTRGQPGTHDEQLAGRFFNLLRDYQGGEDLRIPSFDKSKLNGDGDRAPKEEWPVIATKPDVVVFEGWCVGFRPLPEADVEQSYRLAKERKLVVNTPAQHQLAHLLEVNDSLRRYCDTFMGPQHFDFMIHIDTDDIRNVFTLRLQQEHRLIEAKGTGMTDDQVRAFIGGYMPGYELYLDGLRAGFFGGESGRQIRVVLNNEREVEKMEQL